MCPKGHSYVATIGHRTRKIHRRIVGDRGGAGRIKRTFTLVSVRNPRGELDGGKDYDELKANCFLVNHLQFRLLVQCNRYEASPHVPCEMI